MTFNLSWSSWFNILSIHFCLLNQRKRVSKKTRHSSCNVLINSPLLANMNDNKRNNSSNIMFTTGHAVQFMPWHLCISLSKWMSWYLFFFKPSEQYCYLLYHAEKKTFHWVICRLFLLRTRTACSVIFLYY